MEISGTNNNSGVYGERGACWIICFWMKEGSGGEARYSGVYGEGGKYENAYDRSEKLPGSPVY